MTGKATRRGNRPAPLSIRLSDSERAALAAHAGSLPVSTYIKRVVFGRAATPPRRTARDITHDTELLGRCLAALGKSQLADSLARLARMAETGSLYCDPETLANLRRACDDVRTMRGLLMQGLGKELKSLPPETSDEAAGRTQP